MLHRACGYVGVRCGFLYVCDSSRRRPIGRYPRPLKILNGDAPCKLPNHDIGWLELLLHMRWPTSAVPRVMTFI